MRGFDFESWSKELISLPRQESHEADLRFCDLVEQVSHRVTPEIARVLVSTFKEYDDGGVQECVVSVLSSATPEVRIRALLEDLPRLEKEAPFWANDLLTREAKNWPKLFLQLLEKMPEPVLGSVRRIIASETNEANPCPILVQLRKIIDK